MENQKILDLVEKLGLRLKLASPKGRHFASHFKDKIIMVNLKIKQSEQDYTIYYQVARYLITREENYIHEYPLLETKTNKEREARTLAKGLMKMTLKEVKDYLQNSP